MFGRSAARDTLQGKAIQSANEKWGDDFLQRSGRETIGIPVCKKKYNPFLFHVVESKPQTTPDLETVASGNPTRPQLKRVEVLVERQYGCRCHHGKRKDVILEHGVRKGWQSYGVWSLKKALESAKKEEIKLNQQIAEIGDYTVVVDSDDENVDVDDNVGSSDTSGSNRDSKKPENLNIIRSMHLPGNYTWKIQSAYDDIFKEIHGYSESDAEDLREEFAKRIVTKKLDSKSGDTAAISSKATEVASAQYDQSTTSSKSRKKQKSLPT